jgi:hypothetical protein
VGLVFGKNCADKMVARLPKMKKSYHSISVPTDEAAMTNQSVFFSVPDITVGFMSQYRSGAER